MNYEKRKVLITVKTYPHPSISHLELVCTAGVCEDGSFIRLYPIDYRYLPYWRWYKKYQWIEVEVVKNDKDPRKESYRPNVRSIIPLGEPIGTGGNWRRRKEIVLLAASHSMEQLRNMQQVDRTSLGIVRPRRITDVIVEACEREWKAECRAQLQQARLFGPQRKPLEKIPFKFSYRFECDDPRCTGHKMLITDWGDNGHLQYLPVSYLGFAVGAARSWCNEAADDLDPVPALDLHAFHDDAKVLGKLAHDLGKASDYTGHDAFNAGSLFGMLTKPASSVVRRR